MRYIAIAADLFLRCDADVCGSSVLNNLRVTHVAPRILR